MNKIEIKTRDGLCPAYLLVPRIKARLHIAGAIEDESFPDDMKERFATALRDARVDHQIETYPAKHGWVTTDTPVYDADQSERHWRTMMQLFDAVLKAAR